MARIYSVVILTTLKQKAAFDHQGWYITGDLARIDSDGFLFIEGRLSRFSKIGGEMVPHARVEEEITKAFFPEKSQSLKCAVVGLPDESKGEKIDSPKYG